MDQSANKGTNLVVSSLGLWCGLNSRPWRVAFVSHRGDMQEKLHMETETEAETAAIQLQAKQCQGLLTATRAGREAWKKLPPTPTGPPAGASPRSTCSTCFWPPGWREDKSLLFLATKLVVICYGRPSETNRVSPITM